jgi:signal transduction histidine kinase
VTTALSLRAKMILGISAILLLVVSGYAVIALRAQARHLLGMVERQVECVATVTHRAIANAMEAGNVAEVEAILARVGEQPDTARIRILDDRGKILRSSAPEEVGERYAGSEGQLSSQQRTARWDMTGPLFESFRPISNAPACHRCHRPDETTLGFLSVSAPFPAIDSDMTRQWTVLILAAVFALVAAGVLIWAFFTVMVGRRIEALAGTMSVVEAGDFNVRVPAGNHDELGRLGESFNAMVTRLADARRKLETRHADEMRRAEHLAALGKMAAGVAHEINNPLAGMQNCVRTLLKGGRDDTQRLEYLGMLGDGLDRVGRIVSQLLNFAREARPQLAPTHVPPVLERCLALVDHELRARRIAVSFAGGADVPAVLADAQQIEQLFLNVLMNAVEAMPDGGRLTVDAQAGAHDGTPVVEVRITDTGIGIPAEHLPRIFDPFFTTKEVGKGTGLGLSVSYGIAKAHGASIGVSSKVGVGTTFTVAIPFEPNGNGRARA